MSKYEEYLKELPSRTGEVEIDVTGSVTGFEFKGQFVCRVPSMQDYILADKKRAALNGGVPEKDLDASIAQTTSMLSYLSVVLEEAPKWWKEDLKHGVECLDANLIILLHAEVKKFEADWKKKVWGEPKEEGSSEPKEK